MMAYPCKGCQRRYLACSDHCEEYQEAKRQHAEQKKRVEADGESLWKTYLVERKVRKHKRLGRG